MADEEQPKVYRPLRALAQSLHERRVAEVPVELEQALMLAHWLHKAWSAHRKQSTQFPLWSQSSDHTERLLGKKLLGLLAQRGRFFPVEGRPALVRPPSCSCLLLAHRAVMYLHGISFLSS
jgi:hypothetical protein